MDTWCPQMSHASNNKGQAFWERPSRFRSPEKALALRSTPEGACCISGTCSGDRKEEYCTTRIGSTAKVLAKYQLEYYRISECTGRRGTDMGRVQLHSGGSAERGPQRDALGDRQWPPAHLHALPQLHRARQRPGGCPGPAGRS